MRRAAADPNRHTAPAPSTLSLPFGQPAYGPQPQSACSPLTVVYTCFGPTLRVANAFGVVPTGHALPYVAHLTEGAFGWLSPKKTANRKGFFPQRGRKLARSA